LTLIANRLIENGYTTFEKLQQIQNGDVSLMKIKREALSHQTSTIPVKPENSKLFKVPRSSYASKAPSLMKGPRADYESRLAKSLQKGNNMDAV
jgi:hypothetical protein